MGLRLTEFKVSQDYTLQDLQELSQWLQEIEKTHPGYSCQLQTRSEQAWLLVQAPTPAGLKEIQEFLESRGLVENATKDRSQKVQKESGLGYQEMM